MIRDFQNEPVIRLLITGGKDFLDFHTIGKFQLFNDCGEIIFDTFPSDLKWRIRVESYEPTQFIYTLRISKLRSQKEAEKMVAKLDEQGYEARIQNCGGVINLDGRLISDNTEYQVLIGEFNSYEDARLFALKTNDQLDGEIVQEKIRESRGILEIFDEEYEYTNKINNFMKLIPCNYTAETILYEFGENKQGNKKMCLYQWPISFRIGNYGSILVVCEIPLETYLKEIVQTVSSGQFPLEAMKSLAVVSRSWILSNLGLKHSAMQYDFCTTDHCQLFLGTSIYSQEIKNAIKETRGEVLLFNQTLCETPHTFHCGGHTECKQNRSYLQGIFDGQNGCMDNLSLNNEKNVANWITSQPDVYCSGDHFKGTHWSKQFDSAFRWEVSYSRQKLEKIIKKKTSEDIGTLFDIIPVKRGISGRLTEIEILGSRRNMKIKGDQKIRHTLSESTLKSSCFILHIDMGNDGVPLSFTFIGAGSGDGIGLCQTGAVAMALKGKVYPDILHHYFHDVKLKKIY